MPGMSQAMTKSEFSRAILTLEKFIGHDFKLNFHHVHLSILII